MVIYNVYTDGSYGGNDGRTHGGIVFADSSDNVLNTIHVSTSRKELVDMWNVGGEILAVWAAVMSVVSSVRQKNEEGVMDTYKLRLTYDLEGAGSWILGKWKAMKPATVWYRDSVRRMLQSVPNLELEMRWVKGHAETALNHEADRVADYKMSNVGASTKVCNMDEVVDEDWSIK